MQKHNRQIYDSSRYISTLNENNFLQKIHTFSLLRYSASNVVNSKTKKALVKLYQEHAYHIVSIFTHQPLCSILLLKTISIRILHLLLSCNKKCIGFLQNDACGKEGSMIKKRSSLLRCLNFFKDSI